MLWSSKDRLASSLEDLDRDESSYAFTRIVRHSQGGDCIVRVVFV